MSSASARLLMPEEGVRTLGEDDSHLLHRKGPKPAQASTDGKAAQWFDAAVKCWGKGTAFADELGVADSFLSEMRAGRRGIALRHLLPLLGHPEAVLAFVTPLLESIGYTARPVIGPTFTQLAGAVLSDLDDGSAVTRALIERAAEKRGWSRDMVALALHAEEESK